jgi:ketosteroid isomerase-like protein
MSLKDDIEQTIYQYAWGYDDDDIALLAGAFAEDAVLNHAIDGSTVNGAATIHTWMDEKREVFRAAGEQPRHMLANIVVEQESETTASSRCYMTMMVTRSDGTVYAHHAGRYFDRFVKVGDRWLFSERLIRVDRDVEFAHRKPLAER